MHACIINILYNYYSMQPGTRNVHLTARPRPRAQIDIRLTGPLTHYFDICLCKHVLLVEQSRSEHRWAENIFFGWVGAFLGKSLPVPDYPLGKWGYSPGAHDRRGHQTGKYACGVWSDPPPPLPKEALKKPQNNYRSMHYAYPLPAALIINSVRNAGYGR